jgi:FAD/FMN-containing dehydrogenase
VEEITETREWEGRQVDGLDGVAFSPGEVYLTLATWSDGPGSGRAGSGGAAAPSDYTGQDIYFRSVQQRQQDLLTTEDYLWRWDTDWFWCSGAFGLHNARVRRLWPRRWRRSDVYHKLIGLDRRVGLSARLDARKGVRRERVIQDIEVPTSRLAEFLRWFDVEVGMRPVWLCPLRLREPVGPGSGRSWPSYPLAVGTTYVNVGFWGTVPIAPGREDGDVNRAVERKVTELGGHKSLYSDAYYDPETFAALYNTENLRAVSRQFDPEGRLTGLYEKAVKRR